MNYGMKRIEEVIEEEFGGFCDLSNVDARIAFLGAAISIWENYDIKKIRRVLKDTSDLLELTDQDGVLAEQKKRAEAIKNKDKKCKHCKKSSTHSCPTTHKSENGTSAVINCGGMSKEEVIDEIANTIAQILEIDDDEEEEDD